MYTSYAHIICFQVYIYTYIYAHIIPIGFLPDVASPLSQALPGYLPFDPKNRVSPEWAVALDQPRGWCWPNLEDDHPSERTDVRNIGK